MSLRFVLLGPPGCGKGTLANQLENELGLAHISTGEMFRQEIKRRSRLGRETQRYVSQGQLVPDELVVRLITSRLTPNLLSRGIVLDGFPRTVAQAKGLDEFLRRKRRPLVAALALTCPERLLIVRLSGRQVCPRCGAIYHVRRMPPKRRGFCDVCETRLITRDDDKVATIRKRLAVDRSESKPLLAYYKKAKTLHTINGSGTGDQALARAMKLFRRQAWIAGDESNDLSSARSGRVLSGSKDGS